MFLKIEFTVIVFNLFKSLVIVTRIIFKQILKLLSAIFFMSPNNISTESKTKIKNKNHYPVDLAWSVSNYFKYN